MPPPPPPAAAAASPGGAATPPSKPQSPLRITHEGEFYARLLTRESAVVGNAPSFRYYGAGTGAVPFVWESQPGTPKDAYSSSSRTMLPAAAVAPVITPPPSYYLRRGGVPLGGHSARRHGHGKTGGGGGGSGRYFGYKLKWVKVSFIATLFRRLAFGNNNKSRSSSSSAAAAVKSSSSSSSSSSTRWLFSGSSAADAEAREHEYCGYDIDPAERRTTTTTTKGVFCLGVRPSPWMVQFCFCSGQREHAGLVYGWRP